MKAVLFDMDGTLLDTLGDLHASVNFALGEMGLEPVTRDMTRIAAGYGSVVLMDDLSGHAWPTDSPEFARLLDTFASHYNAHHADATAPYDGICDLLEALCERGAKMAVVSNKLHRDTDELRELYFGKWIPLAIGRSDEVPAKPAPDMVMAACDRLGIGVGDVVYVGDSEPDVQTAVNAGCVSVGCTWGFRDREVLAAEGADYIIDDPVELLDVLEEL